MESCVYAERPECDRLKAELQANLMQTITVAGAGFSGLTTAYFLTKQGCKVRVVEKTDRPGGLIRTIHTEHGLVETAANGLLNSVRLQEMCAAIGVSLMPTRRDLPFRLTSHRYIRRDSAPRFATSAVTRW